MPSDFRLAVGGNRLATLSFDSAGRKVNVFTREALHELERLVGELAGRRDIGCLVLLSGKEGFIAGADLDGIAGVTDPVEAEAGARFGQRLFAAWEALPFPTVAAIRGVCLGGGTEISLASTWRVASDRPDTRIGLPEVRLGILPAWGGSVRLPRRIGVGAALDMILTGRAVSGRSALKSGLIDALLPEARFLDQVRDFALERLDRRRKEAGGGDGHGGGWKELLLEKNPLGRKIVFDQARKKTLEQTKGQYPAPLRALEVVRVGVEDGPRAGFDAEARSVAELATGRVAKNLIHVFRLGEESKRGPGVPGGEARPVGAVAVLGAGTMGGGIAQLVAQEADLPVRLKDLDPAALARGMEHAAGLFDRLVKKRRLTRAEERRKMALIQPALDYSGFGRVDLVIEAIVEKLAVKQAVFAEVAAAVPEAAVLASNTSSLPIGAIGETTPRRERVVGMHFFNPVHRMPLVEVIAAETTAASAVNTVFAFSRRLGKTPVLVRDTPGFLINRLLMVYSTEALWLLDEGHAIEDIDRAMVDWGMPVGPLALTDEVGIDVAGHVARFLQESFPDRVALPPWLARIAAPDRLGTKTGRGFYRYDGRERKEPDPAVYALLGLAPRVQSPDPGLLADRMVLPMVNEAARCLAEGVVRSAGELDVAMIFGTGFPPFRGGLCRWADQEGLGQVVATLERLESAVSERYRPAEALRDTAAAGGFYARFPGGAVTS
ncbi:MAG TPA: 3-hydroxyacyl-CoA dehydrogenase NAD-binding domain-containing protein [Thermoanaerobaculia bacterium]|nr:3-hydroxyacyl-CoA dehydrogenase NAD-binding domain-containing protein [Thermoanaerobaculia bacterium]